jgi:hypothetical protein
MVGAPKFTAASGSVSCHQPMMESPLAAPIHKKQQMAGRNPRR